MQRDEINIWRIMIAELTYYKNYLIIIGTICLVYTTISFFAAEQFEYVSNWYPEFWTWCVAASSYYIIIFIWGSRFKKERDRVLNLLPVSLKSITWFRGLFSVVLPAAFILYFFLVHQIIINESKIYSIKLIGFMSKTIVVLPSLNILIDLWFINTKQGIAEKIVITALTASVICLIVVFMNVYLLPLIRSGFPGRIILLELLFGFMLALISLFVFKKRKSFIT